MDLFTPIVDGPKLHPNFEVTLKEFSKGVRDVLEHWANGFVDRDGKFVYEFQTTYNSSFWELYLFAVLSHLKIEVDFNHSAPDFVAKNHSLVIEATIASNAHDDIPEWEKKFNKLNAENSFDVFRQACIRLSNAFQSKFDKYINNYSRQEHVQGKSFIIAISNYSKVDFFMHGDIPMQWLLYDTFDQKVLNKSNSSEVEIGIFNSDKYAEVSAVLFSSVATFGKARALGNDNDDFTFTAIRIKDNNELIRIVAKKSEYRESLCDGLRLFVNPFARHPIDLSLFDIQDIRKFCSEKNGELTTSCHEKGDLCMRFSTYTPQKKPPVI